MLHDLLILVCNRVFCFLAASQCTQCREGLHALPRKMTQPQWKKRNRFGKTPPPIFKSVEHYLWKGMKPFPALTPPALKHVRMKLFSGSR